MKFRIERLEIENFKGIGKAAYDFGDETRIYGQNATGKSSIVDAYTWLLFNKDSHGNAPGSDRFREKPLDGEGNEVHYIDTTVTGHFTLDGTPLVLRRTQRENWVKQRGAAEATYRGNNSLYWINDVETKASDFAARVNSIASGDVFRLITTLGAFTAMDWKARRALLVSMSGIDVDAELMHREEYAEIAAEAMRRNVSVDDLRKILSDQKTKIARELQLIPARIDENQRQRPNVTDRQIEDAKYSIDEAESSLQTCEKNIAQIQAGAAAEGNTYHDILERESQIVRIKREHEDDFASQRRALRVEVDNCERTADMAYSAMKNAEVVAKSAQEAADKAAAELDDLRASYRAQFDSQYEGVEQPDICPVCHQKISPEARAAAERRQRAEFDRDKRERLDGINRSGKEKKAQLEALKKAAEEAKSVHAQMIDAQAEASRKLDEARAALNAFLAVPPVTNDPRIAELEAQIAELKERQHASPDERLKQFEERKAELRERIRAAREVIAKRGQAEEIDRRIAELEEEQQRKGEQRADVENMIFTIEKFIADRCGLLEDGINAKFPTIRWKLFDRQINGALVDCCECMIPGESSMVSYSATNTAARVNADIEITAALAEHYGVIAPVFFDNAESVNYVARPAGQLITLSVSGDPALRIEQINCNKEVA